MPFSLDRSFTHRLHTLSKITDRQTQQAYQEAAGLPLGEGRCLAAIGSFSPRPLHNLADHPAEARIMLILSRFA